jgi:hypothetical protein
VNLQLASINPVNGIAVIAGREKMVCFLWREINHQGYHIPWVVDSAYHFKDMCTRVLDEKKEVYVMEYRLDALRICLMARDWNMQQHADVFQILRNKKITSVHCDGFVVGTPGGQIT